MRHSMFIVKKCTLDILLHALVYRSQKTLERSKTAEKCRYNINNKLKAANNAVHNTSAPAITLVVAAFVSAG